MNIETKVVTEDYRDYLNFQWKHTGEEKFGRLHRTKYILARDMDMPNYREYLVLEQKYFSLKSQIKKREEVDVSTAFILFLLLIIPGVIYLIYKSNKNAQIDEHNQYLKGQMSKILFDVKKIK